MAIVSHSYWKRLGGHPGVLGESLRINGRPFTIVGVAARGFSGTTAMISPEIYLPLGAYDWVADAFEAQRLPLADPRSRELILVGRLASDLAPAAVDARLAAVAASLQAEVGAADRQVYVARKLSRGSVSPSPQSDDHLRVPALLLALAGGAVGLVLAGMLYRVSGSDPLVLGAAIALLGGVSLLACWVPARRAARVAPMASLRTE